MGNVENKGEAMEKLEMTEDVGEEEAEVPICLA